MENLQDRYSSNGVCFGCGPANPRGLHIKSLPEEDGALVADWKPEPHHTGYPRFTNGGIIATIVDCHGNIAAAYALMRTRGLASPPGTVTAELTVKFLKPTPIENVLRLRAWVAKIEGDAVTVEGSVEAGGVKTASMRGVYVAVKEGHPGFGKWN
jgi:acyl-coenzyme A thioesterase PaaI-like protein